MGRTGPGHFPCKYLPSLSHVTPEAFQIFIINKRYLVGAIPAEFPLLKSLLLHVISFPVKVKVKV